MTGTVAHPSMSRPAAAGAPPGGTAGCDAPAAGAEVPGRSSRVAPPAVGRARRPAVRRAAVLCALVLVLLTVPGPSCAAGPAGWSWPIAPKPGVARPFRAPAQKWLAGHRGVDLTATTATVIRAPEAGTVSFTGVVVDRPVITIDHGNGLKSSFEPVTASVARGQTVGKGRPVGTVAGAGHCPGGRCVHWGVRRHGEYVNPLQFVQDLRPSVLLPVPGE